MAIFDNGPFSMAHVKKAATDLALDQTLKYLSRDPEQNLPPRILDFAERIAPDEGQKKNIRALRTRMLGDEKIMAQIKRLVHNPRMLKIFLVYG